MKNGFLKILDLFTFCWQKYRYSKKYSKRSLLKIFKNWFCRNGSRNVDKSWLELTKIHHFVTMWIWYTYHSTWTPSILFFSFMKRTAFLPPMFAWLVNTAEQSVRTKFSWKNLVPTFFKYLLRYLFLNFVSPRTRLQITTL